MIISVWRYSHLALAVSSFLLLTLASITGIILAAEPVIHAANSYKVDGFDSISVAQVIPSLRKNINGLQELVVDDNSFVTARFLDTDGNDQTAYIHPITGAVLGTPQEQSPFFKWVTSLHRSLFLHETGRLVVGITSFLLILIAASGVALIIKRQKGIRRFFAPIEKTGFAQYYHTVFGRVFLLFILALAVSGAYLSLSRFVLKPAINNLAVSDDALTDEPQTDPAHFDVFQQIPLSEVTSIQFPFSDFPEDYYTLKLHNRQLAVNQFTGSVLAQQDYPTSYTLTNFSLRWHTGRSGWIWAIIMAITAGYILFFIYSGAAITIKRIRGLTKNRYKAAQSEIIILVGSENGSTFRFASAVFRQLLRSGKKAYMADMDRYSLYPKASHIIIMTSTYGEGDPPTNATRFLHLLAAHPQQQPVLYSVVGFGSRSYEHFCRFAHDVQHALSHQPWAAPLIGMMTVNDGSPQDFSDWLTALSKQTGWQLSMPRKLLQQKARRLQTLRVIKKSDIEDDAFIIQLQQQRIRRVTSGDLLAIYPKNDHRERLYSIGKVNGAIQLSVKQHPHGLGSTFLSALTENSTLRAQVIKNEHFHVPKKATKILMVCNGTGIAPFLGMINENNRQRSCVLYCGFKTHASFALYHKFLEEQVSSQKLGGYHLALSREGEKVYVSDLLQRDASIVHNVLSSGGVIMLCGSLAMQKDVLHVLSTIMASSVEPYIERGQILSDCY